MSHMKTVFAATCAAAVLTACATPQSNPHYKYSSKMPADTQATQAMAGPAQAPVTYQAGYSDPAGYPQPAATAPMMPAQTETVTGTVRYSEPMTPEAGMIETGGQNAQQMQAELAIPNTTSVPAPIQAQTPNYIYNSGGYVSQAAANAPAVSPTQRLYDNIPAQAALPAPAAAPAGMTYIVQEGDTAWSLSRKTCSSLGDLKAINNLQGDFLIKAGEAILLPASTC